jgi:hypothetical protein
MSIQQFDRVVLNMMNLYGGSSTLQIHVTGAYDPDTSSSSDTITEYTVRTLMFDYNRPNDGVGSQASTLIQNGDKQLLMMPYNKTVTGNAILNIQPNKDSMKIGNDVWAIISIKELNPSNISGNAIYYELQIRK